MTEFEDKLIKELRNINTGINILCFILFVISLILGMK
jgi:ABC-type transport system involved in cytochrome c biogenesis permease subunit